MSRFPRKFAPWLALSALTCTSLALAQPVVPRPAGPRPATAVAPGVRPPPPPPVAKPGEPDWRGIGEEGKPKKKPTSAVSDMVKNAPYRIEVVTASADKILITNAFTLERRRVFEAPGIAAVAFSPDGTWVYVAQATGEMTAVNADRANTESMGKLTLGPGEVVVELIGLGGAEELAATVLVGVGPAAAPLSCGQWKAERRVVVHKAPGAKGPGRQEAKDGWPDLTSARRTAAVSPNTKYRLAIAGGGLTAAGRFGSGDQRIHRSPVPVAANDLEWMRDSLGVAVSWPRKAQAGCGHRIGMRFYRRPTQASAAPGWDEWNLPDNVEVVRGDLPGQSPPWTPDGMRLVAVDPRGVVLIEPAPRFRGQLALIAPASSVWPKVRPGVRPLASSAPGALRLAELLMEQGDLDQASQQLAGAPAGAETSRLKTRLNALVETRTRRAQELQVDGRELRSDRSGPPQPPTPPPQPSTPVQPLPEPPDAPQTPTAAPEA